MSVAVENRLRGMCIDYILYYIERCMYLFIAPRSPGAVSKYTTNLERRLPVNLNNYLSKHCGNDSQSSETRLASSAEPKR